MIDCHNTGLPLVFPQSSPSRWLLKWWSQGIEQPPPRIPYFLYRQLTKHSLYPKQLWAEMGKQNQPIITYSNWKIVINAPEDMKFVSKCFWRTANCRYIADISGRDNAGADNRCSGVFSRLLVKPDVIHAVVYLIRNMRISSYRLTRLGPILG